MGQLTLEPPDRLLHTWRAALGNRPGLAQQVLFLWPSLPLTSGGHCAGRGRGRAAAVWPERGRAAGGVTWVTDSSLL